jgi:hypothetical protein
MNNEKGNILSMANYYSSTKRLPKQVVLFGVLGAIRTPACLVSDQVLHRKHNLLIVLVHGGGQKRTASGMIAVNRL